MRFWEGAHHRAGPIIAVLIGLAISLAPSNSFAADKPAAKPLEPATAVYLNRKGIAQDSPLYIRIFKEESELEVWKARTDGRFIHVKTYPICNWSGKLGPKQTLGDHMAPEGFYNLDQDSLKPDSKYHLALNIGYPNALDIAMGRSGDFIMVHGKCVSVGCFAMTDDLIEEIYAFVREATANGQTKVPLHIFPFRMTDKTMLAHNDHPAWSTWLPLKEAFDDFQKSRMPPRVAICAQRYVVNPIINPNASPEVNAAAACVARPGKLLAPVSRKLAKKLTSTPIMALGMKTRTPEDIAAWDDSIGENAISEIKKRDENRAARKAGDNGHLDGMGIVAPLTAR